MIYIYSRIFDSDVIDLCRSLDALRLGRFDGIDFWKRGSRVKLDPKDIVVCWGDHVPDLEECRVLNHGKRLDEYSNSFLLRRAGVHTITYTDYKFGPEAVPVLRPGQKEPTLWMYKEDFVNEIVIHSFQGKSIRAGQKVIKDGFKATGPKDKWVEGGNWAHPWIKSERWGWTTSYAGFKSTSPQRELAHKAVKVLGLTFGVVTLGECRGGELKVIGVKSRPSLDNGGVPIYMKAINRWIETKDVEPIGMIVPPFVDDGLDEMVQEAEDEEFYEPPILDDDDLDEEPF